MYTKREKEKDRLLAEGWVREEETTDRSPDFRYQF